MPTANSGIIKIKGGLDGKIFSETRAGIVVRNKPKAGLKKGEPAIKQQYSRTAFVNRLAGEINSIIKQYGNGLWHGEFYKKLLSIFRAVPTKPRLLQLMQLRNMEINPRYQLSSLNDVPVVLIGAKGGRIKVELCVQQHPVHYRKNANCYYIEVLAILWNKTDDGGIVHSKKTNWISNNGGLPEYEFTIAGGKECTDYLVCVRESYGEDEEELNFMETQGMRIVAAGCFDKEGLRLLKEERLAVEAEKLREKKNSVKKKDISARMMPKKVRALGS